MQTMTLVEERLHAVALEVTQNPETPEDEREMAACVLTLFREVQGYRSLGIDPSTGLSLRQVESHGH